MRKTRKVKLFAVFFLVTIFVFAGCGCLSSIFPSLEDETPPSDLLDSPDSSLSLRSPLCIITGENSVNGVLDFWEKMNLLYNGETSLLRGRSLVEEVNEYLEDIKNSNTILLIIPPTSDGIQEFRELEAKYPTLCSISSTELEAGLGHYSSPLMYFSESDIDPESPLYKMRGVIVSNEVTSLLAELLSIGSGVAMDVFFRYDKNGQLLVLG